VQVVAIDASGCRTVKEFCDLLKDAIRATEGHGRSIEAFVDSMVWGAMSDLAPPYAIAVSGLTRGPVSDFAHDLSEAIGRARIDRRTRRDEDIEVSLRIVG
jgi:hypothetical protein